MKKLSLVCRVLIHGGFIRYTASAQATATPTGSLRVALSILLPLTQKMASLVFQCYERFDTEFKPLETELQTLAPRYQTLEPRSKSFKIRPRPAARADRHEVSTAKVEEYQQLESALNASRKTARFVLNADNNRCSDRS